MKLMRKRRREVEELFIWIFLTVICEISKNVGRSHCAIICWAFSFELFAQRISCARDCRKKTNKVSLILSVSPLHLGASIVRQKPKTFLSRGNWSLFQLRGKKKWAVEDLLMTYKIPPTMDDGQCGRERWSRATKASHFFVPKSINRQIWGLLCTTQKRQNHRWMPKFQQRAIFHGLKYILARIFCWISLGHELDFLASCRWSDYSETTTH